MRSKDRRRRILPVPEERRGRERREHERVLVNFEVDYKCDDTFLFAYITDLSAVGIFIQTNKPHPPGTHLNLRFQPPGGPQIDVEGRVIWVNRPRGDRSDDRTPAWGSSSWTCSPASASRSWG